MADRLMILPPPAVLSDALSDLVNAATGSAYRRPMWSRSCPPLWSATPGEPPPGSTLMVCTDGSMLRVVGYDADEHRLAVDPIDPTPGSEAMRLIDGDPTVPWPYTVMYA